MNLKEDQWFMGLALEQAEEAFKKDEVPVGAIVVDGDGAIVSQAHNLKESNHNPLGHAELIALKEASSNKKSWRLTDSTLYVTLEPCPMCLAACVQARVKRVVFGAYDKKGGAISLGYKLFKDPNLNHGFSVIGGIDHFNCSKILSDFFRLRREQYKNI